MLIEIVFSRRGAGQYAIEDVLNPDLNLAHDFIVLAACFPLAAWSIGDLLHFAVDRSVR